MASVQPKPNGPLTRIPGAAVLVTQRFVKWRVVTMRGGKLFLFFLEFEEYLLGSEVIRSIIELCRSETMLPASIDGHCLRGPVVEAAILDGARHLLCVSYARNILTSPRNMMRSLTVQDHIAWSSTARNFTLV